MISDRRVWLLAGLSLAALIGPNASGKSTLFRCIAGLLRSDATIRLDGGN